jgi:succinate dehydrogenase / fumarate reductase membrane anchor subunit
MLFFIVFMLAHFCFDPPQSFSSWRGWIARPDVSLAAGAFSIALLAHAWVGGRDVIIDYVRPVAARGPALVVLAASLLAIAAWVARTLLLARG